VGLPQLQVGRQHDNEEEGIAMDNKILEQLAADFVELHEVGGIELEQWETAHQFVRNFYDTESIVQIRVIRKKPNKEPESTCTNCGNDAGAYELCLDCLSLIECKCKGTK